MTAPVALLLACAAAFVAALLLLFVAAAYGAARNIADGPFVTIARGLFVTAFFIVPLVTVFALGWGFGTGWQS